MIYTVYLEYSKGKSKGHEYRFEGRDRLLAHLQGMATEDNFALACNVVFTAGSKKILSIPASTPIDDICNAFIESTRGVGKPVTVKNGVTTSIYMERELKEFLKKYGNGSASRGINLLLKQVDNDELQAILNS